MVLWVQWGVAGNKREDKRGQTIIQCLVNTRRHLATLNYHWLPKMIGRELLTAWKCHLGTCIITCYSPITHWFAVLYSVYLTWQDVGMDVVTVQLVASWNITVYLLCKTSDTSQSQFFIMFQWVTQKHTATKSGNSTHLHFKSLVRLIM